MRRPFKYLAGAALVAAFSLSFFTAQVSGPTVVTPHLTVRQNLGVGGNTVLGGDLQALAGTTTLNNLTVNGTCTGCAASGAFAGHVDISQANAGTTTLPTGWSVSTSGVVSGQIRVLTTTDVDPQAYAIVVSTDSNAPNGDCTSAFNKANLFANNTTHEFTIEGRDSVGRCKLGVMFVMVPLSP